MRALVKLCAWCPDGDAVSELFNRSGDSVTHSICGTCAREVMSELEKEEEVDALIGPVVSVIHGAENVVPDPWRLR